MSVEGLVLVDTNILVYALTAGSDPRHEASRLVLKRLIEEDRICSSTQVLQETLVTLTKKYAVAVEDAIRDIQDLMEYPVFITDKGAIVDAARLAAEDRISFWDSLIVVAALRLGANTVLSEDLNHGQLIRGLRIQNPFAAV